MSDVTELYPVESVPTCVLIRGGKTVATLEGANAPQLIQLVTQHARAADAALATAVPAPFAATIPVAAAGSSAAQAPPTPVPADPAVKAVLHARLSQLISAAPVMAFIKGTVEAPRCGFSKQLLALLKEQGVQFGTFDILSDNQVREGLKEFYNWPTYPQLYISGELIGGLDIVKEMVASGDLAKLIPAGHVVPPKVDDAAEQAQLTTCLSALISQMDFASPPQRSAQPQSPIEVVQAQAQRQNFVQAVQPQTQPENLVQLQAVQVQSQPAAAAAPPAEEQLSAKLSTQASRSSGSRNTAVRVGVVRSIPFRDIHKFPKWPVQDCAASVEATLASYFFISHAWLSPEHPDPEGIKWALMTKWQKDLLQFREHLLQLAPENINREAREDLTRQRLKVCPIMTDRHDSEIQQWARGFKSALDKEHRERLGRKYSHLNELICIGVGLHSGGWTDVDKRPAAASLLAWLLDTVDAVLDNNVWIDSWATSPKSHRDQCERCSSLHQQLIPTIENILYNADACAVLGGFALNEDERGWMLLEACAARLYGRLQGSKSSQSIAHLMRRMFSGQYRCTNKDDGVCIPLLFAAAQIQSKHDQIFLQRYALFLPVAPGDLASQTFTNKLKAVLMDPNVRNPVVRCELFLSVLRRPEAGRLALESFINGDFLLFCATRGIHGIICSFAKSRGAEMTMTSNSLTALQAALYVLLVKSVRKSTFVSRAALSIWAELVAQDDHSWPDVDLNALIPIRELQAELKLARSVMDFWLSDERNVIQMHGRDFLEPNS